MNENTLLIGKKREYGIYNLKTKEYITIAHSHESAVQKIIKIDEYTFITSSLKENTFKVLKF